MTCNDGPYEMIDRGAALKDVQLKTASMTEEELAAAASKLSDDDVDRFGAWAFDKLQTLHVDAALLIGWLLLLYRAATDTEGRRGLFKSMCVKHEIDKTRAYSSMGVFRKFGSPLLENPALKRMFPVESLKLLSGKRSSLAAREAALAIARKGERVTIKCAQNLIAKHSSESAIDAGQADGPAWPDRGNSDARPGKKQKPPKPSPRALWSYCGEVVTVSLEAASPKSASDVESIIRDLEAALAAYRSDFGDAGDPASDDENHDAGGEDLGSPFAA